MRSRADAGRPFLWLLFSARGMVTAFGCARPCSLLFGLGSAPGGAFGDGAHPDKALLVLVVPCWLFGSSSCSTMGLWAGSTSDPAVFGRVGARRQRVEYLLTM